MSTVIVTDKKYVVDPLFQWDQGQTLEIRGLSLAKAPEVHFDNSCLSGCVVKQSTMDNAGIITVNIPNVILQKPHKITAYICDCGVEEFRSLYAFEIPVKPRKKPEFYEVVDEYEIYSIQALTIEVENEVGHLRTEYERLNALMEEDREILEESIENYNNANAKFEELEKVIEEQVTEQLTTVGDKVEELETELAKTTYKVDTVIANVDLSIKETASGEEIHLTDSAEGKAVEFALYGKARQNTTQGKNLIPYPYVNTTKTENGISFVVEDDGSIKVSGTATDTAFFELNIVVPEIGKTYTLNGLKGSGSSTTYMFYWNTNNTIIKDIGLGATVTITDNTTKNNKALIVVYSGNTVDFTVYPMISVEGGEYEPFTNGASPNPQFPQSIEIAGESYNLLENKATSQTINGVEFVVNEDNSVSLSGTPNNTTVLELKSDFILPSGDYILSGCPSGGASTSNYKLDIVKNGASAHMDIGNGVAFNSDGETTLLVRIVLYSGASIEGKTFYPMIRKASVKNDRYMPYGKGSVEVKSLGKNYYNLPKTTVVKEVSKLEITDTSLRVYNETNGTNVASKFPIDFSQMKAGKTYTLSADVIYKNGVGRLALRSADSNTILKSTSGITTSGKYSLTFELPSEDCYISLFATYSTSEIGDVTYSNIQLEEGETVTEYQPYIETLSTIPTPNGLAGIKVSSGGNYTDQNGQQWICDEVVKYADGSGEYIQRIGKLDLSTVTEWAQPTTWVNRNAFYNKSALSNAKQIADYVTVANLISNRFTVSTPDKISKGAYGIAQGSGSYIYVSVEGIATSEEMLSYFANNESIVYYPLAEPITTPLTAEEIAEISTFYPVTNISNDFDCGMKLKYNCDSKNYIDKKIAEMFSAMNN